MKKHYIILSVFLILGIISIIISIYIARQNLSEISQEKEEPPAQEVFRQLPVSPIMTEQEPEVEEKKKREVELEGLELNLEQIPDEYFNKDIEDREQMEEVSSDRRKLNKQPSGRELKELKTKGIIIY